MILPSRRLTGKLATRGPPATTVDFERRGGRRARRLPGRDAEKGENVLRRNWTTEQKPLSFGAARGVGERELFLGLDAFRDRLHAERLG